MNSGFFLPYSILLLGRSALLGFCLDHLYIKRKPKPYKNERVAAFCLKNEGFLDKKQNS